MQNQKRRVGLYWMENTCWYSDGSGSYRDLGRLTEAAAYEWARRHAVPVFRLSPAPESPSPQAA